jgi:putative transposase
VTEDVTFVPAPGALPAPGLVLRIPNVKPKGSYRYLRLTHVFEDAVFGMWMEGPEFARYAKRPFPLSSHEFNKLRKAPGACLGQAELPIIFTQPISSDERRELDALWDSMQPLVSTLDRECNLSRRCFSAQIRTHSELIERHFTCVWRCVIRYYYFGRRREALRGLPPGSKPGENKYQDTPHPRRRGRKSETLEDEYGPNDFVRTDEDVEDMLAALRKALADGPAYITEAYELYLRKQFKKRHPDLWQKMVDEEIAPPVSIHQYRRVVEERQSSLDPDLAENIKGRRASAGLEGAHRAFGPGEIYEIDATGGQVVLVTKESPPRILGPVWVYILIDRWSRYIPAVYVTLRHPSVEEVKQLLLVMLTARERFRFLGVDVTEITWPGGRAPICLCSDRGSELTARGFLKFNTEDLKISNIILPALNPDAKAIIERVIRTLKRRVTQRLKGKGAYSEKPTSSPQASKRYRKAKTASVTSLPELYRILIEEVLDYNSRPHKTLEKYPELSEHGKPPIPKEAFLWGCEHISGIRVSTLSSDELRLLAMQEVTAEAVGRKVRYEDNLYSPVDSEGRSVAARWRKKKPIRVRLDELGREIRVPVGRKWVVFRMTEGQAAIGGGRTKEEQARHAPLSRSRGRIAANRALVARLKRDDDAPAEHRRRQPPVRTTHAEQNSLGSQETEKLKRRLRGPFSEAHGPKPSRSGRSVEVDQLDDAQLDAQIAAMQDISKQRRK